MPAEGVMRIAVVLDRARLFQWHAALVSALTSAGHTVIVRFRADCEPLPTTLTAILDFDHARAKSPASCFSHHIKAAALPAPLTPEIEPADVTLDLSSSASVQRIAGPVLRPLYDGSPKDYALFHALLNRHAPYLALWDSEARKAYEIGRPALDTPLRLAASLDQTASRLIEGLLRYFSAGAGQMQEAAVTPVVNGAAVNPHSIFVAASDFLSRRTLRKTRKLADAFSGDAPRWHVAWRRVGIDTAIAPGALYLPNYQVLGDDGAHSYAQPCLITHDGQTHLFVAETAEATGKSWISHLVLERATERRPMPVLELEASARHPFVFAHGGGIWMLVDDAGSSSGLDLYRCTKFPDAWQRDGRLIDGQVHDATLFRHDGRLWIAAAGEAFQSSASDALALYWADALHGPWHGHSLNPVRVDARSSRPAGSLWLQNGRLYRPAQDCSGDNTSAITVLEIVDLTPQTVTETAIGRLAFPPPLHTSGPHTICRGGGFEVIDFFARPSALRAAFRAGYRAPTAL